MFYYIFLLLSILGSMLSISLTPSFIFMIAGFLLSLYTCVSNDVIQTLGTYLSANREKPFWILWFFSGAVLILTAWNFLLVACSASFNFDFLNQKRYSCFNNIFNFKCVFNQSSYWFNACKIFCRLPFSFHCFDCYIFYYCKACWKGVFIFKKQENFKRLAHS